MQNSKKFFNETECGYSIFLYGDCGKTRFYTEKYVNRVEIDARQILDIKSLLGNYVVKNTEFYYEKGILIKAMESGVTLIVKNIDYNAKLFNFLKQVIENKTVLFENQIIKGLNRFRIVFTAQTRMKNRDLIYFEMPKHTLNSFITFLSKTNDLTNKSYNKNQSIDHNLKVDIFIACFARIYNMSSDDALPKQAAVKIRQFFDAEVTTRVEFYHVFSTIFFASLRYKDREEKELLLLEILCLSTKCVEVITCLPTKDFILTKQVQNTIRDIVHLVNNAIPILLVGETGTGKTTLVQTISEHSKFLFNTENKLEVVNFSSDIDLNDLIGSYQSNDEDTIRTLRQRYPVDMRDDTRDDREYLEALRKKIETNAIVMKDDINYIKRLIQNVNEKIVFKDGVLTKAIRNGHWILFDEINLASKEVLDAICGILNQKRLFVPEYTTGEFLEFHKGFRVFACMNPGNDHGKKDFDDYNFAKIFYDDFSCDLFDIEMIARQILANKNLNCKVFFDNVNTCRAHDSQALVGKFATAISNYFYDLKNMIDKNIVYGPYLEPLITGRNFTKLLQLTDAYHLDDLFDTFFYTQIHEDCEKLLQDLEQKYFDLQRTTKQETYEQKHEYTIYHKNQKHVGIGKRCISANMPVLLQGPTSTGKTSLIFYLSKIYGKTLYRINNHEQTETSDYLGSYTVDSKGDIVFKKGIFIQAVEKGDWILLDELNLAPSEILEVLNRLLDNNKEIVLNGNVIKAHKDFRLFATQNLSYGGRKMLSKAFRNRFVELNYSAFTQKDVKQLLDDKKIPQSFQKKMLDVYDKLSSIRSYNMLITVRDLFKWISRRPSDIKDLFFYGLNLLYVKQRSESDKTKIVQIFEKVFELKHYEYERYVMDIGSLHSFEDTNYELQPIEQKLNTYLHKSEDTGIGYLNDCMPYPRVQTYARTSYIYNNFLFTESYVKLFNTLKYAVDNNEAVLLVGGTGLGKTKFIDIFASLNKKKLYTVSAHQHLDSSDLIGTYTIPFAWNDGPLIKAMRSGSFLLVDEINLAQDSVLERFNSVLEDGREITILETDERIKAHPTFNFFACMNPGNDFGKRELSPALRNRFTEIHFSLSNDEIDQIFAFLLHKTIKDQDFCYKMLELFKADYVISNNEPLTVRKISDIVEFIAKLYNMNYKEVLVLGFANSVEAIYKEVIDSTELNLSTGWDIYNKQDAKGNIENGEDIHKKCYFGVAPYFIAGDPQDFHFASKNMKVNAKKILKAMIYDKGILLKGDPGTGKTTFIENLGKKLGKDVVRINLCDETELADLCGNFLPVPNENNEKIIIKFVESKMLKALKNSQWVILDEINLASQSVLEGLNSALDYRKKFYIHETVDIGKDARIFATMNKEGVQQGRKNLPKSFLDRFVVVEMCDYYKEDISYVINERYRGKMSPKKIEKTFKDCLSHFCSNFTLRKALTFFDLEIPQTNDFWYKCTRSSFAIGCDNELLEYKCTLDNNYVILHSEVRSIFTFLKCIQKNIPVIIKGNFGKSKLVNFVAKVINHEVVNISCFEDMDINDFLGNYQMKNKMIKWVDSILVDNIREDCKNVRKLVVFDNPEKIEKAVFDRLNSLFERERTLFIHEKGLENEISIEKTVRFVFLCNDLSGLSNAIIDRAWVIELNDKVDTFDINKIIDANKTNTKHGDETYNGIDQNEIDDNLHSIKRSDKTNTKYSDEIYNSIELNKIDDNLHSIQRSDKTNTKYGDETYNGIELNKIDSTSQSIDNSNKTYAKYSDEIFEANTHTYDETYKDLDEHKKFKRNTIFIKTTEADSPMLVSRNNIKCLYDYKNKYDQVEFPETFYKYTPEINYNCVRNTIFEDEIDNMFKLSYNELQLSDLEIAVLNKANYNELLCFYKKICYNTPTNATDLNKVKSLNLYKGTEQRIINFMKNRNISCIKNPPNNINELKFYFLKNLKNCQIIDFGDVKAISDVLKITSEIESTVFDDYYDVFISEISGEFVFDPILLLKTEFVAEKIESAKVLQERFAVEYKNMYKYGKSKIEEVLLDLNEFYGSLNQKLTLYNKKLERNYNEHVKRCGQSNFVEFFSFLPEFSDFTDYSLVKKYNDNCNTKIIPDNSLYFLYAVASKITGKSDIPYFIQMLNKKGVLQHPELCKSIFTTSKSFCEMLLVNNEHYEFTSEEQEFVNKYDFDENEMLEEIFDSIFDDTNTYGIHFYDLPCLRISKIYEIVTKPEQNTDENEKTHAIKQIQDLSIFAKPEYIIEQYKSRVPELSDYYKKMRKDLTYNYNYTSYAKLFLLNLTKSQITEYLLNTKVHQFLERIHFISEYINDNASEDTTSENDASKGLTLLYNLSLQYKSLELDKKSERIKKSIEKKVWYCSKETKVYTRFLEEETINQIKDVVVDDQIYECTCVKTMISNEANRKTIELFKMQNTSHDAQEMNAVTGIKIHCNKSTSDTKTEVHEIDSNTGIKISRNNNIITKDTQVGTQDLGIQDSGTQHSGTQDGCDWKYNKIDKNKLNLIKTNNFDIYEMFMQRVPHEFYSQNEILLGKIMNEYVNNSNYFTKDVLSIFEELIRIYFSEEMCVNFLCYVYKGMLAFKEYEEDNTGDGLKEGTGEKNISEDVKNEDEIQNEDNYEEPNEVQESDGVEMSNEGVIEDIENSEDELESDGCNEEQDGEEQDGEELDIEELDEELDGEEQEELDDSEEGSEVEPEQDSCQDSGHEASQDTETDSGLDPENTGSENDFYAKEYAKTEDKINEEQTCDFAVNYDFYVQGNNNEEKALEEGNGNENIEKLEVNNEAINNEAINNEVEKGILRKIDNKKRYNKLSCDAFELANYLRNVFEGNKKSKYNGNFKSGKKLSMKKIVPFILSDYKKDKIWLRRNLNEKREYVLRFFIDASQSMNDESLLVILFQVLQKITKAFEILEMKYEIYKFGSSLKKFDDLNDFIESINFCENETNLDFIKSFDDGINLVLTDGIFQINYERNENFMLLLIDKKGIKDLKKIVLKQDGMEIKKYLDTLTMRFCIIENITELEHEFINALSEMVK